MGIYKIQPVPKCCVDCTEAECYNCDYALARWSAGRKFELESTRKLKLRAIARLQRQIAEIDWELEQITKQNQEP